MATFEWPARASNAEVENTGVINCVAYEEGRRVRPVDLHDVEQTLRDTRSFIWIGLHEPTEDVLRKVQRQFNLHDLAIEDAYQAHQRPKVERYSNSLFVVVRTAQFAPPGRRKRIEFGETHLIVGQRYIVAVRHGFQRSYVEVRNRCEANPDMLALGPAFVLYALFDFLVDQYLPLCEVLEEDVAQLEDQLIGDTDVPVGRGSLTRIYGLKRELLALKRAVGPLTTVCSQLMHIDSQLVPAASHPYFRDVLDQVVRLNEMLDNMRELLSTASEISLSLLSLDENQDMKELTEQTIEQNRDTRRLAAWAAIIAVPTMIAGIYGMNFEYMPELGWPLGYPLILLVMASLASGLFIGFKRSHWL